MKHPLFSRVILAEDIPSHGLRQGDSATIVEHFAGRPDQEPGYALEVFSAEGDTVAVISVRESQIEALHEESAKLASLRADIQHAVDQVDRGEVIRDFDMTAFLAERHREHAARLYI